MKKKYDITGMSCAACSARIERILSKKAGITRVSVSLPANSMNLDFDESLITEAEIVATVEKAGFGAFAKRSREELAAERAKAERGLKRRLIGSLILLVPLFYLGMYHMLPHPKALADFFHTNPLVYTLLQLLLALPICWLNRKLFINGFRNLINRSPNMDSLIAVGAGAALLSGFYALVNIIYGMIAGDMLLAQHYGGMLYFESAGMILSLVTVGKYLEERSKGRTNSAIEKLLALAPQRVTVEREGRLLEIAADDLLKGDIAIIHAGERIPADGIITEGSSSIDEAALTGESLPVEKKVGDRIFCACTNQGSLLKMQVEQAGDDTLLAQIIRLVEEASATKAPIAALADRISLYFVPIVMSIAALVLIIWLLCGCGFEQAFTCAISVLVISCPCALGLATPMAITVGVGKGAQFGILIKSGEALQRLQEADTVVFDKTGTLTKGKPILQGIYAENVQELLLYAASAEQYSEHLLAQTVLQEAQKRGLNLLPQEDFRSIFGMGIACRIEGRQWLLGNSRLLTEEGIALPAWAEQKTEQITAEGSTPLLAACDKQFVGLLAVADEPKEGAAAVIETLNRDNVRTVMLTGDNRRTAASIADRLGIKEVLAEVLPTDKEAKLAELLDAGHKVIMVGDGINDAPALKRASVGIAIGGGTDIAVEAADIVLMNDDLAGVLTARRLSFAVIRNIRQNLFWAFFYNCLGIPLAAGLLYPAFGLLLNPMIAAAAMSLSSLFVVSNALRLKLFK